MRTTGLLVPGCQQVGHFYQHDQQGLIKIIGGAYYGEHGKSNHFTWQVVATGETHRGYGGVGYWPEVTDYGLIGLALLQGAVGQLT